ncbi:hypothetical protein GGS21DRAFT_487193 [Xylaria nigripes]|nr:hypothetical protein GGS21DRAFT_487193 [Xylaria nigripes]
MGKEGPAPLQVRHFGFVISSVLPNNEKHPDSHDVHSPRYRTKLSLIQDAQVKQEENGNARTLHQAWKKTIRNIRGYEKSSPLSNVYLRIDSNYLPYTVRERVIQRSRSAPPSVSPPTSLKTTVIVQVALSGRLNISEVSQSRDKIGDDKQTQDLLSSEQPIPRKIESDPQRGIVTGDSPATRLNAGFALGRTRPTMRPWSDYFSK